LFVAVQDEMLLLLGPEDLDVRLLLSGFVAVAVVGLIPILVGLFYCLAVSDYSFLLGLSWTNPRSSIVQSGVHLDPLHVESLVQFGLLLLIDSSFVAMLVLVGVVLGWLLFAARPRSSVCFRIEYPLGFVSGCWVVQSEFL
jgi:hypothetical protein